MSRFVVNVAFGFDVFEVGDLFGSESAAEWLNSNGYPDIAYARSNDDEGWCVFTAKSTWLEVLDSGDHCNSELRYISQPTEVEQTQLRALQTVLRDREVDPGPIGFIGLSDIS